MWIWFDYIFTAKQIRSNGISAINEVNLCKSIGKLWPTNMRHWPIARRYNSADNWGNGEPESPKSWKPWWVISCVSSSRFFLTLLCWSINCSTKEKWFADSSTSLATELSSVTRPVKREYLSYSSTNHTKLVYDINLVYLVSLSTSRCISTGSSALLRDTPRGKMLRRDERRVI